MDISSGVLIKISGLKVIWIYDMKTLRLIIDHCFYDDSHFHECCFPPSLACRGAGQVQNSFQQEGSKLFFLLGFSVMTHELKILSFNVHDLFGSDISENL